MPCPTEVTISDNLVFSVITHDPDTGLATDADAVPTYLVYEDETTTAILTGSMAKLDDANTTGCYSESLACTAGNGFEDGKTYTIYVSATVGTEVDACAFAFRAVAQDATDTYARIGVGGAGLTVLATATALSTHDSKLDTVDGIVDSILTDTAEIGVAGAGLIILASAANLAIVDTVVDTILTRVQNINAAAVTLQSPINQEGNLELISGDSYSLSVTKTNYTGSVTGASPTATAHFAVLDVDNYDDTDAVPNLAIACTFTATTQADGSVTIVITVPITAAQTDSLAGRPPETRFAYKYQLYLKDGAARSTIQMGKLTAVSKVAPV